jgi:hypothetical protein
MADYNWLEIFRSKSISELKNIISSNAYVDNEARVIAFKELKSRHLNEKELEPLRNIIRNEYQITTNNISKTTLNDYFIQFNPYGLLIASAFIGINGLLSFISTKHLNYIFLFGFILMAVSGVVSLLRLDKDLQKIKDEKEKKLNEHQKFYEDILKE